MKSRANKTLAGAGLVAAIASSLCCVTPVVAVLASVGGFGAAFSWIEPARPYLLGFTAIALGLAWYLQLRPAKVQADDCECEIDARPSFWKSRIFLGMVTVFAAVMMTFPYYSQVFFSTSNDTAFDVHENAVVEATMTIDGMTCTGCEHHVSSALLSGRNVFHATASYESGTAVFTFDTTATTLAQLAEAVERETGYRVIGYTMKNKTADE